SPATATLCRPQLSAPPLTLKTQIAYPATAVPVPLTPTTTNAALIPQPHSLSETGKSDQTLASNAHRLTPPPAQTPPALSSLEAFRTPAAVHVITARACRRPKTLNKTGP